MSSDSAGQPWRGRAFEANAWAGDDGSAPLGFEAAVLGVGAGSRPPTDVLELLRDARLLVPLVAGLAESGHGEHGVLDKRAELALPTVAGPDGRRVLPAFSSAAAMSTWDASARPIPAPARQVALGAAGDGVELVIIDPGSPTQFGLRRGAVEALARDLPWTPSWQDEAVLAAFRGSAVAEPAISALRVQAGDRECTLDDSELRIVLVPADGRGVPAAVVDRLSAAWATAPAIVRSVDSVSITVARAR